MKKSIRAQLTFFVAFPLVAVGMLIMIITVTLIQGYLLDEVQDSLRATAVSTLAAYDQNSGEYLKNDAGDIWKGNYNISESGGMLDTIKAKSKVDVTFFYGDQRITTSAKDKDGNRVVDSKAGSVIVSKVLNNGKEYFSKNVKIEGVDYYGYYIPVFQKGDSSKAIGMIFAGTEKKAKDAQISKIRNIVIVTLVIAIIVFGILSRIFATSLVRSIKSSIEKLRLLSEGNLNIHLEERELERKDEVGQLAHSVETLQIQLKEMIGNINENNVKLLESADSMEEISKTTVANVKDITSTIQEIAEGATEQAESVQSASEHIGYMGKLITNTTDMVRKLNESANSMHSSSENVSMTLKKLNGISNEVVKAVDDISVQIKQTSVAASNIKSASELIAEIAEETNLLSLNASIEAARAGEAGKGFAVVASQIQKLADQSNEASGHIDEIVTELITDAIDSVKIMDNVTEVIDKQNEHMNHTGQVISEVILEINQSVDKIEEIAEKTTELDDTRNKLIDVVKELSVISQENAANTEESNAMMVEIEQSFNKVNDATNNMKIVEIELEQSIKKFNL